MTTTEHWIDQAQTRCDAATEGPWALDLKWDERHGTNYGVDANEAHDTWPVVDGGIEEDADFIAHARTDLPRALAALRAVLNECEFAGIGDSPLIAAGLIRRAIEESLA